MLGLLYLTHLELQHKMPRSPHLLAEVEMHWCLRTKPKSYLQCIYLDIQTFSEEFYYLHCISIMIFIVENRYAIFFSLGIFDFYDIILFHAPIEFIFIRNILFSTNKLFRDKHSIYTSLYFDSRHRNNKKHDKSPTATK